MRASLAALAILPALSGCDSGVQWRDKEYEVLWIDTSENRSLVRRVDEGGGIGRVEPEVIAVGSNEHYVVVKQRSLSNDSITYFVVPRQMDNPYLNAEEITEGPFSSSEFEALKVQKGLPEFSAVFGE